MSSDDFNLAVRGAMTLRGQPVVSLDTAGYNVLKTYQTGDLIIEQGCIFLSLIDNNLGNPLTDQTSWKKTTTGSPAANTFFFSAIRQADAILRGPQISELTKGLELWVRPGIVAGNKGTLFFGDPLFMAANMAAAQNTDFGTLLPVRRRVSDLVAVRVNVRGLQSTGPGGYLNGLVIYLNMYTRVSFMGNPETVAGSEFRNLTASIDNVGNANANLMNLPVDDTVKTITFAANSPIWAATNTTGTGLPANATGTGGGTLMGDATVDMQNATIITYDGNLSFFGGFNINIGDTVTQDEFHILIQSIEVEFTGDTLVFEF